MDFFRKLWRTKSVEEENMDHIRKKFHNIANENGLISKSQFTKIMGCKNVFFSDRVFDIIDQNKSNTITLDELINSIDKFTKNQQDKLRFLFKVYDVDNDGKIAYSELISVLRACVNEGGIYLSDSCVEMLAVAIFEDARNKNGFLSYDVFEMQINKYVEFRKHLEISIDDWLNPSKPEPFLERWRKMKPHRLFLSACYNNFTLIGYLAVYFIINIAIFVTRWIEYRNFNIFFILARSCGQCLNFNCSWVLVLMLRYSLTWLRSRGGGFVFPIDHHVYLHRLTGLVILGFSVVHTVMHFCNLVTDVVHDPELNKNNYSIWEWLLTSRPRKFGLVDGYACPSGLMLFFVVILICLCSHNVVRQKSFRIFYWSHMTHVLFWLLLLIHGPNFWKWILLPVALYVVEKINGFVKTRYGPGSTYVSSSALFSPEVTLLIVKRPRGFNFKSGDYVFVNIPEIAHYEWHPFTISSSPHDKDFITFHIRGVGGWTKKLFKICEEENKRLRDIEINTPSHVTNSCLPNSIGNPSIVFFQAIDSNETSFSKNRLRHVVRKYRGASEKDSEATEEFTETRYKPLKIYVDGPYGGPSTQIFDAEHAVLIGVGIGVTPFASILQTIMYRYKKSRQKCPECKYQWLPPDLQWNMNIKKVDFIWVVRYQTDVKWFFNLLSTLENDQEELSNAQRFLSIHIYLTSAVRGSDMKATMLQLALNITYMKTNKDLITGLQSQTHTGRPDWDKVFEHIKQQNKGKVTAFYCGRPDVAKDLKRNCVKHEFDFRNEAY